MSGRKFSPRVAAEPAVRDLASCHVLSVFMIKSAFGHKDLAIMYTILFTVIVKLSDSLRAELNLFRQCNGLFRDINSFRHSLGRDPELLYKKV